MENNQEEWVLVDETMGPGLAEVIRGFLLSCGIEARILHEGAWEAFPLSVGGLGKASVLVHAKDKDQALEYLKVYYESEISPDVQDASVEDSASQEEDDFSSEEE